MPDTYTITETKTVYRDYIVGRTPTDSENMRSLNPVRLGTGLPNCVREQLAQCDRVQFSLLMDCAIKNHLEGANLTIAELAEQTGLTVHTIRQAVDDPLISVSSRRTTGRGRPENVYRLPHRQHVINHVTAGKSDLSDHLPQWAYTSVSNYRKARYFMLIARSCQYVASAFISKSRKFLCDVIGVCKATLIKYEEELNILVIGNIQKTAIDRETARQIPAYLPGAYLKVDYDGRIVCLPAKRLLVNKALKLGATITLIQFLPNTYSLRNWDKYRELTA